jgi:hypothetical protein
MGEFPTTGYISELLIALGFVNIRYTESDKLAKVLGVPTAATGLVYEKYDKQLRKLNIYPDKVYQFLLGIHTCGMSPRTTTMAGKEDVRYPALIRDVWMLTILDPLTFCKYWTEDYIHSTVDNPTPENLIQAVRLAWLRAKTLFGVHGTYRIITPYVKESKYWMDRVHETQRIIESEVEFTKRTSIDVYKYMQETIRG